ncbi:MAG: AbrB/MazE/SpoVT family DNA-binding domain-containing protein [Chloroflexi bacterium]|nr:AbrB/MazE/SpoVT family DNA-binding domain-containing protein [Chloroflexota bacterium]
MEVGINLGENNEFLFSSAVINAHGQIVIPVKFRKQYNIQEGDTLILLGNPEQNGFGVMTSAGMSEVQKQLRIMNQMAEKIDNISK